MILDWTGEGEKILDIGCGDGALGERLIKEKKCTVYGIDLDKEGVKESIRRGIKAKVWDADERLPYKDGSFDGAVVCELLQFARRPDFVVTESLRVAKRAIFAFPNFGFWFYRLETLFGRFPRLALYGHGWWEMEQRKYFSLSDFMALPPVKKVHIKRLVCINWRNRKVSWMAKIDPNLFGRSVILEVER